MRDRLKMFVVDDDPLARTMLVEQLAHPEFEIAEFGDAASFQSAADQSPDIVLLDVEMPGTDGIEACRRLRESGNLRTQVLFVSAHDDLDTRLAAYEAGGNDYLVKPYAPAELAQKVLVAKRAVEERRELSSQASFAEKTAFSAMSSMGEMGAVMQFLRASFACRTPEQIAGAIFDVLDQYGVGGLVEIHCTDGRTSFPRSGVCTPLEASILGHARNMERIFQFRDRMVINYDCLTMLLLNLPIDDPERLGRLRDHLAVVAEGAQARLLALESDSRRTAQADAIIEAVAVLTRTLGEIEAKQRETRQRAAEVTSNYLMELERAFVHLGLTETQERSLLAMAEEATKRASDVLDDGVALGDRLRQVTASLHNLAA